LEVEWESAIQDALRATRLPSGKVYDSRWPTFDEWYANRSLIAMSATFDEWYANRSLIAMSAPVSEKKDFLTELLNRGTP
jgi:hypothetical protein